MQGAAIGLGQFQTQLQPSTKIRLRPARAAFEMTNLRILRQDSLTNFDAFNRLSADVSWRGGR